MGQSHPLDNSVYSALTGPHAHFAQRRGNALRYPSDVSPFMALHPPGWTEISGVCTDADWRGQGLGTRLLLAVAAGIRERGETPFLHVLASNTDAVRLYESLGFRLHRAGALVRTHPPTKVSIDLNR